MEAAEAQCGELRRQMAELEGRGQGLEAALAAAEGRAAEAEEALASRGTAHAQQVRTAEHGGAKHRGCWEMFWDDFVARAAAPNPMYGTARRKREPMVAETAVP